MRVRRRPRCRLRRSMRSAGERCPSAARGSTGSRPRRPWRRASISASPAARVFAATSSSTSHEPRSTDSAIRRPSTPSRRSGISSLGRSDAMSAGCGPATTFSKSAQSAIVRASTPSWQYRSRLYGAPVGTRPCGALNPTTPLIDAGILIDPPMSEPLASIDVPRGERRPRAAARSADRDLGVPRVPRHAPELRVRVAGAARTRAWSCARARRRPPRRCARRSARSRSRSRRPRASRTACASPRPAPLP